MSRHELRKHRVTVLVAIIGAGWSFLLIQSEQNQGSERLSDIRQTISTYILQIFGPIGMIDVPPPPPEWHLSKDGTRSEKIDHQGRVLAVFYISESIRAPRPPSVNHE